MDVPVLIHCRKAFRDLLLIMREEHAEKVGGIMHAFSGSAEVARDCIRLGFAISIAGPVTYLNAVRPVELVRNIPLEHLVLETDAPDMPPSRFGEMPTSRHTSGNREEGSTDQGCFPGRGSGYHYPEC